MTTVTKAHEAAEDAVINSIKAGLETYAVEQLLDNGRRIMAYKSIRCSRY